MAVLVTPVAVVVITQWDDRSSANEPRANEPWARAGIDHMKSTCPTAEPDKLPPNALAGATNAAVAYFEGIEDAEGQHVVSANRGLDGDFSGTTSRSYRPSVPSSCKGAPSS